MEISELLLYYANNNMLSLTVGGRTFWAIPGTASFIVDGPSNPSIASASSASSSISSSAQMGIIIAVVAAVVFILVVAAIIVRRRRKNKPVVCEKRGLCVLFFFCHSSVFCKIIY